MMNAKLNTAKKREQLAAHFDERQERILLSEIGYLWQQIGSDAIQACEEFGEPIDNESAVEMLLDAQRLEDLLGEEKRRAARHHDPKADEHMAAFEQSLKRLRELEWRDQVLWLMNRRTFA